MKTAINPGVEIGTVSNRKHITKVELARLVDAASGNRWSGRDVAMLNFAFRHGLRVSELVALRWCDIDWSGKAVVIMRRKQRTATGTRANVHPLADDEVRALKALRTEYGDRSDFVFATERKGADDRFEGMTTSGFSKLIRRLAAKAGVQVANPHALRHGRAQSLADAGRDAFLIRDALGHANVATSSRYVAASPERLRGIL